MFRTIDFNTWAAMLGLMVCGSIAQAAIYTGSSGGRTTSAAITTGTNTITVTLENRTGNPTSAGDLLNGITFNVTDSTGSGVLAMTKANLVTTINADDSYTAGVLDPLTRWKATETGANIVLTTLTGGNPDRLIVGPDSLGNYNPLLGGKYTHANASIIGDNPNVLGPATFVITAPGVTSGSTISSVIFRFGTQSETTFSGTITTQQTPLPSAPEPASLAIWGIGALGCTWAGFRRRKAA